MRLTSQLCIATSTLALAAASSATAQTVPPAAASPAANASTQIQEVVVTARRQQENLEKVPVAVTAFNASALQSHNITGVDQLGRLTPSLQFSQSQYGALGTFVSLRGQRADDLDITQTPSVGVYVDDVYQPSTLGLSALNLEDAASVEVLKGPQGTLYGRNTTGGAIRVSTASPDYSHITGLLRLGAGNENDYRAYGDVSIPLYNNEVALRLSGNYERNDGYGYDAADKTDISNVDLKTVQATLGVKPNDRFEADFRFGYIDAKSGGLLQNLASVVPGGPLNLVAATQLGLPLTPAGLSQAYNVLNEQYVNQKGTTRYYNGPLYQDVLQSTEAATFSYKVNDNLTVKSITAFVHLKDMVDGDNDGTPFRTVDGDFENQDVSQTTEELQALGSLFGNRMTYTVGYYYYDLEGDEWAFANILYPLLHELLNNNVHVTDLSQSGYVQVTYKILDHVRFTGGLRYTDESDPLISYNKVITPAGTTCEVPAVDLKGPTCQGFFTNRNTNLSYTAGLDWQVTDSSMLYFKTSRGFKAGGVNERGTANGGYNTFLPEQVTDYEIGSKSEFWDRRVRLNLAMFYEDYTDIQRSVLVASISGSPATAIQNAAAAAMKGFEAELTVRPAPGLTLNASGSYIDAKYSRYRDALTGADLSHNVFPDLPTWQGSLSVTYEHPTSLGPLAGTIDLSYQSKVNYSPDNNLAPGANPLVPNGTAASTTQAGYALVNGRLSWTLTDSDTTISLWARNLLDRRYFSGAEDQSGTVGFAYSIVGQPRTFGAQITKRF